MLTTAEYCAAATTPNARAMLPVKRPSTLLGFNAQEAKTPRQSTVAASTLAGICIKSTSSQTAPSLLAARGMPYTTLEPSF